MQRIVKLLPHQNSGCPANEVNRTSSNLRYFEVYHVNYIFATANLIGRPHYNPNPLVDQICGQNMRSQLTYVLEKRTIMDWFVEYNNYTWLMMLMDYLLISVCAIRYSSIKNCLKESFTHYPLSLQRHVRLLKFPSWHTFLKQFVQCLNTYLTGTCSYIKTDSTSTRIKFCLEGCKICHIFIFNGTGHVKVLSHSHMLQLKISPASKFQYPTTCTSYADKGFSKAKMNYLY